MFVPAQPMPPDDEEFDPREPDDFSHFMAAVMEAWHEDGITDPKALMQRAETALAALPPVDIPAGVDAATHAKALTQRVDEHPTQSGRHDIQDIMNALKAWPRCAEAYMFVARMIEGREHGILLMQPFYMLALESLWERLGSGGPIDREGKLKDAPETSMYLKALAGLGEAMATQGRYRDAMAQFAEYMRFDPEDRENVRPRLALVELLLGQKERARDTLASAPPTLLSAWVHAFVTLALGGDNDAARKALAEARGKNAHLWSFVVGTKTMSGFLSEDPEYDAAQFAMLSLQPAFVGQSGLREWVQHVARAGHAARRRQAAGTGRRRRR